MNEYFLYVWGAPEAAALADLVVLTGLSLWQFLQPNPFESFASLNFQGAPSPPPTHLSG